MRIFFRKYRYKGALLVFTALFFYMIIVRVALVFSYSLDLDGAEHTYVHMVQRLLQDKNMYDNPSSYPFLTFLYTPLYFYLYFYICKIFNLHVLNDLHAIYIVGRIISFSFFSFQIILIYLSLKKLKVSKLYSLIIITLFMMLMSGGYYVTKMDSMKIFFFSLFLFFLIKFIFYHASISFVILSLLSALFAVCVKQETMVYIFLSLIILLFIMPSKKTIGIVFMFIFSFFLLYFFMYLLFGIYFIENIFGYNFQIATNVLSNSMNLLVIAFSLVRILPLFCICIYSIYYYNRNEPEFGIGIYLSVLGVVFCLVSHVMMMRPGAYLNYTYETIVILTFVFALFLNTINNKMGFKNYIKVSLFAFYIVYLFVTNVYIHSYNYSFKKESEYKNIYTSTIIESERIKEYIGASMLFLPNSKIIVFFPFSNIIYGYDYHVDRYIDLLVGLKLKSHLLFYSSNKYDAYFKNGNVKYIVLPRNVKSRKHMDKYYDNFNCVDSTKNLLVYKFIQP